ncbi:hypothetical protein B0H14DRAFT_2576280 [Mycena olivaceomarginata]|nr:hypothetical protein B0H14DRAFT_2576280 [Mycena olivaceomarginata]
MSATHGSCGSGPTEERHGGASRPLHKPLEQTSAGSTSSSFLLYRWLCGLGFLILAGLGGGLSELSKSIARKRAHDQENEDENIMPEISAPRKAKKKRLSADQRRALGHFVQTNRGLWELAKKKKMTS